MVGELVDINSPSHRRPVQDFGTGLVRFAVEFGGCFGDKIVGTRVTRG